MNNAQLYLAVAIPSVLVILSWINNNTRLTAMERRMDSLEAKIDRGLNSLEAKMDRRFDGVIDGIGSLRERVAVVESKQS